jgi:hypothetical protein
MDDTEDTVRVDADRDCRICRGKGWHWGWDEGRQPVMLRCPCVEWNRATGAASVATE